jgi:hypothetical protein
MFSAKNSILFQTFLNPLENIFPVTITQHVVYTCFYGNEFVLEHLASYIPQTIRYKFLQKEE